MDGYLILVLTEWYDVMDVCHKINFVREEDLREEQYGHFVVEMSD